MSHPPALLLLLLLLLPAICRASAEKLDAERLRLHEQEGEEHHDAAFDQELLMGKEESQKLQGMQREQALKRLAELFDSQIDANSDGKASKEELLAWLDKVSERQLQSETDSQWAALQAGASLNWSHYAASELPQSLSPQLKEAFRAQLLTAVLPTVAGLSVTDQDKPAALEFVSEIGRKRRRWVAADANKDGSLSKEEFRRLLFPEEFADTRHVLVEEELQRLDKDGDGRISLQEFVADSWNPTKESEDKEPSWVAEERRDFREKKDKNSDGFLDREEVAAYQNVGQEKRDLHEREVQHLLAEADADKDGQLGRQEMLDSLDLMAGSAATNFGDHLGIRDEL